MWLEVFNPLMLRMHKLKCWFKEVVKVILVIQRVNSKGSFW